MLQRHVPTAVQAIERIQENFVAKIKVFLRTLCSSTLSSFLSTFQCCRSQN